MNQKKIANILIALAFFIPFVIVFFVLKSIFSFGGSMKNPFVGQKIETNLNKATTGQVTTVNYKFNSVKGDLYIGNLKDYKFYDDFLRGANKTLDMEIYDLSYNDVKITLREKAQDGVVQRILTEKAQYNSSGDDYSKLQSQLDMSGIDLKSDDGLKIKYLHTKFVIVDNSKFSIQTANLASTSFFKNNEAFFFSSDEDILRSLKYIFDSDWRGNSISEYSLSPNIIICPINCRTKIENILNSAQKSIYIQTQSIQDKNILDILKQKTSLDLKLILSDSSSNKKLINTFGKDKLKIIKKPYIHIKSILVDDKYLIIGSTNLTQNSLDNNREVSLVLIDDKYISQYKSFFDDTWK